MAEHREGYHEILSVVCGSTGPPSLRCLFQFADTTRGLGRDSLLGTAAKGKVEVETSFVGGAP